MIKQLLLVDKRKLLFFFDPMKTRAPASSNPETNYTLKMQWEQKEKMKLLSYRCVSLTCLQASDDQCFDFKILRNVDASLPEKDVLTLLKAMSVSSSTLGSNVLRFTVDQCFEHIELLDGDVVSCAYRAPPVPRTFRWNYNNPNFSYVRSTI